jgi:hypothetical protein
MFSGPKRSLQLVLIQATGRYFPLISNIYLIYKLKCGPGSSVGIATDYRRDGQGSNPGGDKIFRPSRPALEPTQPPVKWLPGLYRG